MTQRQSSIPRRGFTLIELLVVIGIIILLISILLPVAGRVRLQAQTAKTQATIASIAGAMEQYYLSEHAYPGLFTNAQLAAGTGSYTPISFTPAAAGAGPEITMTENAVQSMAGGFEPVYNAATGKLTAINVRLDANTTIGKGPLNYSPVSVNRVRKAPFLEGGAGSLLPTQPFSVTGCAGANTDLIGTPPAIKDSGFPEFYDGYSNARPIIILRANVGASGVCTPMTQKNPATPLQYTTYEFTYYQRRAAPTNTDFPGDFQWNKVIGDFEFYANEVEYIRQPGVGTGTAASPFQPRGRDKFLLISAGVDRCFGTKDDIIYGAN